MKRYSSVDFLRGLAIFLMIFVHTMMRWVNRNPVVSDMGEYSLFIVIFLLANLFFGGWCGLFLMVSSTGNMISMQKSLERGIKVGSLAIKQIVGGFLLLICAVLTESVTGYHGYIGTHITGESLNNWRDIISGGFHFETIHAVAWCIILNGVMHAILSKNEGWKKINRNIVIYIILALVVVVATPIVWNAVAAIELFEGFPYGSRHILGEIFGQPADWLSGHQYGFLGYDSIWNLTLRFMLGPLAAAPEPLFPFLSISFIGSIIGLFIMRKQKELDGFTEYDVSSMKPKKLGKNLFRFLMLAGIVGIITFGALWQFSITGDHFNFMQYTLYSFLIFILSCIGLFYFIRKEKETSEYKKHTLPLKIGMLIGLALFVIGLIGVAFVTILGPEMFGTVGPHPDPIGHLLGYTYDVRSLGRAGLWLHWFCVVSGAQIGAFSLLLRVNEFRGKAHKFGKRTLWMRRFGAVPFSIYNYQFIDFIPPLLLSVIGPLISVFDGRNGFAYSSTGELFPSYGFSTYGVYGIWFVVGLLLLLWWLILWLWEKIRFIGGFEWFLAGMNGLIFPSKRKGKLFGGLNVEASLRNPEWVDIVKEEQIPRDELVDSKLSFKLSIIGILIAPIGLATLFVSLFARKKEGKNWQNTMGLIIAIFDVLLAAGIIIGAMFIFGISIA